LTDFIDDAMLARHWSPHREDLAMGPSRAWEADRSSALKRRIGKSMLELGETANTDGCPDIWELENGDIAVIGREATTSYQDRLPSGVTIRHDERLVIIPRSLLTSAKPDIPDA
jgi:hypothetical protein